MRFFPGPQWTNPLMGWNSTSDPMSDLAIKFPTKETAIAFAAENGAFSSYLRYLPVVTYARLGFEVEVNENEHQLKKNSRTYGSKFRFEPAVVAPDELDKVDL